MPNLLITLKALANTFGVYESELIHLPRVGNPGLKFANAFGVIVESHSVANRGLSLVAQSEVLL